MKTTKVLKIADLEIKAMDNLMIGPLGPDDDVIIRVRFKRHRSLQMIRIPRDHADRLFDFLQYYCEVSE